MPICLLIEDEEHQRRLLARVLRQAGYQLEETDSGEAGLAQAAALKPDVILLDLGLPDGDGLALLPRLLAAVPHGRVVVLTGDDSARSAVAALTAGAFQYLVKPCDVHELLVVVGRAAVSAAAAQVAAGSASRQVARSYDDAIEAWLDRAARAPSTPVLIQGETGVGKEVLARRLHAATFPEGPFVPLNCAAVPQELLESELFGHEAGAFTGAVRRRRGLAELANGGTLFLDEIGDMPLPMQAKLLRFLDDRRFRRVGGEQELSSRCRVVAASHRPLAAAAQAGSLRSDLYYRLAVLQVEIPPLRERPAAIVPLAQQLLEALCRDMGRPVVRLSSRAEELLASYPWPGNVRELRNALERALVVSDARWLTPHEFFFLQGSVPAAQHRLEAGEEQEREALTQAWRQHGGVIAAVARALGKPRHWVKYRLAKYGLRVESTPSFVDSRKPR